jgi:hypothetical protein
LVGKRQRHFELVAEFKEQFRSLPTKAIHQRLDTGMLQKEAAIALRELLEERESRMRAVAAVPIRGSGNAWKVAGPSDPPDRAQEREVTLEIRGNAADGYHLVMSPSGCFTADTWHETIGDAKATAAQLFGVPADGWA